MHVAMATEQKMIGINFLIHVPRVLVQNQTLHTATVGPPGQLGTPSPRPRPGMDHWGIMDSNLWTKCVTVSFESFIKYSSCHVITVEFVALHVFDCLIYSNLFAWGLQFANQSGIAFVVEMLRPKGVSLCEQTVRRAWLLKDAGLNAGFNGKNNKNGTSPRSNLIHTTG